MFRGIGSGIGMRTRTKVILWLLALGVVVMLVIFSEEPSFPKRPDTCSAKGIDPSQMKEGICVDEGSTLDETGNLDIANFGQRGDAIDAKSVLSDSEIGVMRTYEHQ